MLVRAADAAGNVSQPRASIVAIDTQGPTTTAWSDGWGYRSRGRRVAFIGFGTHDMSEVIKCVVVVRLVKSGRVVCRRSLGWRLNTDMMWWGNADLIRRPS